jgi:hypothetical protein
MPANPRRLTAAIALLLGSCWGCSSGGSGTYAPSLVPVKGKVTFKGQPLTKGVIRFEPDGYGRHASGALQPDGSYVLTTLKPRDGVIAGHHRVWVSDLDKNLAKDRGIRDYLGPSDTGLTADVSSEKTEFNFAIP